MKANVSSFGKVGVLYGGRSAEREVSVMSGTGVQKALASAGVDAHLFDTGSRTLAELAAEKFDRVFIALHGRYGEDGTIQGALELLGIPYTGSGPLASALAMDKIMTKRIWLNEGLPTPRYVSLDEGADPAAALAALGLPLVVKPPHEGSSIGVVKVEREAELRAAVQEATRFEAVALVEQFVRGRELTVAILGQGASARALPVIEIIAPAGQYDYQNKYFTDDTRYVCPAELAPETTRRVQEVAEAAYRLLGCEGWGRVDVMLGEGDEPYLLEVNTSPGMTGHSLVPMAAAAAGMDYSQLCVEILKDARCKVSAARP